MFRLRRLAGKRLLAFVAALVAALGGAPALAQSDPFALPAGVTARNAAERSGPGLSEIVVDDALRARLVDLAWSGETLTVDAAGAEAAGLPVPAGAVGAIPLASLRLARWSFDPARQRLEVQLFRNSDGGNLIDLTRAPRNNGDSAPLTAFRVDYDLTATWAHGRTTAAGVADAALIRGNASLVTGVQFVSDPAPRTSQLVRLDTQVQVLFPGRGIVATAGDFIGAGGQSQRALRLGGAQIASDYSLRPDLVTNPLPSFTGQVAVPTGLDVISSNQRYELGEVQPGEFTVRNVPSAAGRGEVSVILRDTLGREVIQNTRFYVSRLLLAPRLSEFAVNAGFVRRRYGLRSHDYGPLAASAFYRRGLSSRLTVEATGEWSGGLVNGGGRADLVIGALALATVEARISRRAGGPCGTLLNLGIESVGRGISGRIGAILPSRGYRDVAARLGDPLPPRQLLGQISFDLARTTRFQLSVSRQKRHYDARFPALERRNDVIDGSFRTQLRRGVDVYANAGYRRGERTSTSAFLGLSIQLGGGRNVQSAVNLGNGSLSGSAGFYKSDIASGDIGYGVDAIASGASQRVSGRLAWRSPYGRVEGQLEDVNGRVGARANARGTVLVAAGAVFARNQTGGSYALVRTRQVGGVTILRENRPAGLTAKNGLLLVENVPAQVPISFDVDPDTLPADALARATHRRVVIPRRAVGLVALDVIRFRPVVVRIVLDDGEPVAAGTSVVAQPSGERTMVGFDGTIDYNAAGADRRLVIGGEAGPACEVEFDGRFPDEPAQPTFVCRSVPRPLIADAPDEARPGRMSSRRGTRAAPDRAESRAARLSARLTGRLNSR